MPVRIFPAIIGVLYLLATANEVYRGNGRLSVIYFCYAIASFALGLEPVAIAS